MRALAVLALLLAPLPTGCRQNPVQVERPSAVTTSGVEYVELFVGTGLAAQKGDEVTFEYTVWLDDGTRVDSTYDRGVALTVEIGRAPLPAFDEGLLGIQPQGRRRLSVPPELAYGAKGVEGMIPPNATLRIEILALDVRRPGAPPGS